MIRENGDADARSDGELHVTHIERYGYGIKKFACEMLQLISAGKSREQAAEFIATEAAYHVLRPQCSSNTHCDHFQQLIARWMPVQVVYGLEPIQVNKEYRDRFAMKLGNGKPAIQFQTKKRPIRQIGQAIMHCHVPSLFYIVVMTQQIRPGLRKRSLNIVKFPLQGVLMLHFLRKGSAQLNAFGS
jgi:hypothetical protein